MSDTIAAVDFETGRLVPPTEPFAFGVVWGKGGPEERMVTLDRESAMQASVRLRGNIVYLFAGNMSEKP